MNIAFITTYMNGYYFRPESVLCINNGFSFISHLFKDHKHFFLNISNRNIMLFEINSLIDKLKTFDVVYLSLSDYHNIDLICKMLDSRFVVGGPTIQNINTDKISKITNATFIKTSFEKYLNVPTQNIFIRYWGRLGGVKQFVLNHSNACYNKCSFCNINNEEAILRRLDLLLNQMTSTNELKYIFLSKPSITIDDLEIIKEYHNRIKTSNTILFFYIRSDNYICEFINNNFDDLDNLEFFNGLEYFSNSCLKRINKNATVEDALNLTRTVLNKNGKIILSLIENAPQFNEDELFESIENFYKFAKLFINYNKLFFNYNSKLFFNNEIDVKNITQNYSRVPLDYEINNNEFYFAECNTDEDERNNKIFKTKCLDLLFDFNRKKLKEHNRMIYA